MDGLSTLVCSARFPGSDLSKPSPPAPGSKRVRGAIGTLQA